MVLNKISPFILLFLFSTVQADSTLQTKTCNLTYLTKSDLNRLKTYGTPISTISQSINSVLKSSFDFANLIDNYTLGFVSAMTIGKALNANTSFKDIKPNEWNRAVLSGSLVYKSGPLSLTPIKRAQIQIVFEKKTESIRTDTRGEFSAPFYKWVPYTRLRLFPFFIVEQKKQLRKNYWNSSSGRGRF